MLSCACVLCNLATHPPSRSLLLSHGVQQATIDNIIDSDDVEVLEVCMYTLSFLCLEHDSSKNVIVDSRFVSALQKLWDAGLGESVARSLALILRCVSTTPESVHALLEGGVLGVVCSLAAGECSKGDNGEGMLYSSIILFNIVKRGNVTQALLSQPSIFDLLPALGRNPMVGGVLPPPPHSSFVACMLHDVQKVIKFLIACTVTASKHLFASRPFGSRTDRQQINLRAFRTNTELFLASDVALMQCAGIVAATVSRLCDMSELRSRLIGSGVPQLLIQFTESSDEVGSSSVVQSRTNVFAAVLALLHFPLAHLLASPRVILCTRMERCTAAAALTELPVSASPPLIHSAAITGHPSTRIRGVFHPFERLSKSWRHG